MLKLILLADDLLEDENKVPTKADFVEKREIDRSTLYSFDGPFQLIYADVGNLEYLGSSAATPRYVLLIVNLYSSKIYVHPMRSRKQIVQKMTLSSILLNPPTTDPQTTDQPTTNHLPTDPPTY